MHPTKLFQTQDIAHLCDLIEAHPFALIIASKDGRSMAAHTPILVDRKDQHRPELRFHLANANPITAAVRETGKALAVVTGPHAYISPDWYGLGPDQVPTWNYLSAEAEGPIEALDIDETRLFLEDLSATFEASLAPKPPWSLDKMNQKKLEGLLNGITAFRLIPKRFEGVIKLNQNKTEAARNRVAEALGDTPLARQMKEI